MNSFCFFYFRALQYFMQDLWHGFTVHIIPHWGDLNGEPILHCLHVLLLLLYTNACTTTNMVSVCSCVCANNATSTIILNLIVFPFLCCTTILCMTEKQDWKSDINLMKAARQFPELMMFAMSTSIKGNCLIISVSAFHGVTIHHKMNLCDCNWQILIWRTVLHFGPLTYKYNYHCCHLALVNAKWLIKMH